MTKTPDAGWLAALPRNRLLGEYSLWSADLANLERDLARTEPHTDLYHVDVADGRFAPSFLFFPDQVARIRALTAKPLHVHLMVEGDIVLPQIRQFAEAGADHIIVHAEAGPHLHRSLQLIRSLGKRAGVAINPGTPVEAVEPVLDSIDLVLAMTVNPGFGGQAFLDATLPKIARLRQMIGNRPIALEVDGGITAETAPRAVAAGAGVLVAGTSVFGKADRRGAIAALKEPARC